MHWFRSLSFKRVLMQFSTSYILFVLIPVLVLNVASHQAIRITEENAIRNNMAVLSQGRMMIDSRLKIIDSISPQIFFSKELLELQYLGKEKQAADYYTLWKGIQAFRNLDFMTLDLNASVYYNQSDLFLSSGFLCHNMEEEYGSMYSFGNLTFEEFKAKYCARSTGKKFFPCTDMLLSGHRYNGILYAMPISPEGLGSVFFLLKEDSISGPLASILNEGGSIYILDHHNELLYFRSAGGMPPTSGEMSSSSDGMHPTSGETNPSPGATNYTAGEMQPTIRFQLSQNQAVGKLPEHFFGKDRTAIYDQSDYGLKYIAVMPKTAVFHQVRHLSFLAFYLNIAAIVLAVGWALYLAFRNSIRIAGALDSVSSSSLLSEYQGGNVLDYISNSIAQLVSSNQSLRSNEQKQLPILREAFLDKLVNDSFAGEAELKSLEEKLGLQLEGFHFCVLAVFLEEEGSEGLSLGSIERIERFKSKRQYVLSKLENDFQNRGYVYGHSIDQIVIICRFTPEELPHYQKIAETMITRSMNEIYDQVDVLFKCAGSDAFSDIRKVFENYTLCRELFLRYSFLESESIIMWNEAPIHRNRSMFVFPPEFENKLIHQIKAGEGAEAQNSIRWILKKNLEDQVLSPEMNKLFLSQITITLIKSLDTAAVAEYEGEIYNIGSVKSADLLREKILKIVQSICESYKRRNDSKVAEMKKEMVSFVEQNYDNPELSLKYASEKFHLSEAYFSLLFKELSGENFSAYLDRIRMQRANELLQAGSMKIDEIARQCGYLATGTFRRAYKRYFGVSPSKDRDITG